MEMYNRVTPLILNGTHENENTFKPYPHITYLKSKNIDIGVLPDI